VRAKEIKDIALLKIKFKLDIMECLLRIVGILIYLIKMNCSFDLPTEIRIGSIKFSFILLS